MVGVRDGEIRFWFGSDTLLFSMHVDASYQAICTSRRLLAVSVVPVCPKHKLTSSRIRRCFRVDRDSSHLL